MERSTKTFPAEPLDWAQHVFGETSEPIIRHALRMDARLNIDVLKQAIDLVVSAIPLCGCRYDERRDCWVTDGVAAARILTIEKVADDERERTVKAALLAHLNPAKGPQLRVTLVRSETAADELVVIINHMVADAPASQQLLCILASTYTRLVGHIAHERGTAPTVPASRSVLQVAGNLTPRRIVGLTHAHVKHPKLTEDAPLPPAAGSTRTTYITRDIPADVVQNAANLAAQNGCTLDDVLLTAFGRTVCSVAGIDSVVLPCPVDLRRFARAGQTCGICNLTGYYSCRVSAWTREPLMNEILKVARQIRVQQTSDECLRAPLAFSLAAAPLPYPAVRKMLLTRHVRPSVSYSNTGATTHDQLSFGEVGVVDMTYLGSARIWPDFQLCVNTFDGTMRLSACMEASEEASDLATTLLEITAQQFELFSQGR